jgi:MFS transporter, PPP family, 3-phenylpropionic acid transporter
MRQGTAQDGESSEPGSRAGAEAAASAAAWTYAVRASLFYATAGSIIGIFLAYMPVLLEARGLSHAAIGFVLALPAFIRIFASPAAAFAYDRAQDTRLLIGGLALLGLVAFAVLAAATSSFLLIVVAVVLQALAVPSLMPLTEAVAMRGVTRHGLTYGTMRVWASVAFVAANFAAGYAVAAYGPEAVPALLMLTAASVVVMAGFMPDARRPAAASGSSQPALRLADAGQLLRSRRFLVLIGTISLIQGGHALLFTFATVHWLASGISATHIGGLWAIGILAEIALFLFAARPLRLLGPGGLIVLGAVGGIIRWGGMAFDPPLVVLYLLQALHAVTFGCTHLGTMFRMTEGVPRRLDGTAQGLYSAINGGLMMGGLTLASGGLYAAMGEGAYLVMAGLSAIALWPALALQNQRGPMLPESLPAPAPKG